MFGREFEKKVSCALDCIGKGAAALSEAGNAVYTMSHAMQKQGISGLLQQEPWKEAKLIPNRAQSSRKSASQFVPQDADEQRAILRLRLERAMQDQDVRRVQQLSRELDEIDGPAKKHTPGIYQPAMHMPVVDKPVVDKPMHTPVIDEMPHVRMQLPPSNRRAAEDDAPPPRATESAPAEAATQTMSYPFVNSCSWHGCPPPAWGPPSCPSHWLPAYLPGSLPNYPPNVPPNDPPKCSPNCPWPAFGYREVDGMARFTNPQAAVLSGVSARVEEPPLQSMESHAMVVGITTPQASRPFVAHGAVRLSQTCTRPSAPSLHTTFVRSGSPPRVEELSDVQFSETLTPEGCSLPGADAELAVPSLASPVARPASGGLPSGRLLLEGPSSQPSSAGLFPAVVSASIEHPRARSLEMHQSVQGEKAPETTPMPKSDMMAQENHEPSDDDSVGSALKGIYEVETLLDMRETDHGTREFLIKWKGWGPRWNNWEPEEHILDRRLMRKFNTKRKRPVEVASSPDVDDFTMCSKRRCAKQAAVKARLAARNEHVEEEDE